MSKYFIFFTIILGSVMCNNPSGIPMDTNSEYDEVVVEESAKTSSSVGNEDKIAQQNKRKVIRTGDLYLESEDLQETVAEIKSLVAKSDAYLADESVQDNNYHMRANFVVRIPANSFDSFLKDLEGGKAKITGKNIHLQDVTKEFIDLEVRLANKEKYIQRYLQLLKKSNSVKEILEVQTEIRQLEEEIESTKGQLKYLTNQTAYSTLQITVIQNKDDATSDSDSFWSRLKSSIAKGWRFFVDTILVLFALWPFGLVTLVLIFLFRKYRKRRKKQHSATH